MQNIEQRMVADTVEMDNLKSIVASGIAVEVDRTQL